MTDFTLIGLDGGNPLAFLAALGTLRAATLLDPASTPLLSWQVESGAWRPVLSLALPVERENWLDQLAGWLKAQQDCPARTLAPDLTLSVETYRAAAHQAHATATSRNRIAADYLAAYASDQVQSQVAGKPSGLVADTALRTMSGAGHQHFLAFMKDLASLTTVADLQSSLFSTWTYQDPGPSLRWDPGDDRRYALRWRQPSGDPLRTMRGANRLAVEALPMMPAAPVRGRLETTGFTQVRGRGTWWRWPIWDGRLSLDVTRSLLSLPDLQIAEFDRARLLAMGVVEVFASQRFTFGKLRNFSPAVPA
jgi:hypothetical protein